MKIVLVYDRANKIGRTERVPTAPPLSSYKRGLEQVKKYSWEKMTKQTLEVYKQFK